MARPLKAGLDFFNLDVGFLRNIKIQQLLRYTEGPASLGVLISLYSRIYESGFFLPWSEDECFMIAKDIYCEEEFVSKVVDKCLENGIFEKSIYERFKILTNHEIQEKYFFAVRRRIKNIPHPEFVYPDLKPNLKPSTETGFMSTETEFMSTETGFMSTETEFMSTETGFMSTESTQIKENKIKRKDNLPSVDYPRPRTREAEEIFVSQSDKKVFTDVDEEVSELLKQEKWKSAVFERFGFLRQNEEWLEGFLLRWAQEAKISSKQHINLCDAKNHFAKWMIIQEEKFIKTKNNEKDNSSGYRTDEDIIRGTINIYKELRAENPEPSKTLPVA